MKRLETLIRLHKRKLDEKRQKLGQLQGVAAGFVNQIAELESAAASEARVAEQTPETAHMIGSYVQGSLARRDALRSSLADVQAEIDALTAEVTEAYKEVRRFEIIEERQATRARRSLLRRERKAEDEVGAGMYRRNRTAAQA